MSILLKLRKLAKRAVPDAIGMLTVNRKLARQLEAWETAPEFDDIRALDTDQLTKYLETEWTRAKELDEKLTKLTVALSVAVTVGGVASKTIFDGLAATPAKTVIAVLLFVSMSMFLCGALIGFSGLRPKPRYGYGAGYLRIIARGGNEAADEIRKAASGFQIMNIIRSNEASTAIKLIRNGVVAFTIAIAVSFFVPTAGRDTSSTSTAETLLIQTHGMQLTIPVPPSVMGTPKPELTTENRLTSQGPCPPPEARSPSRLGWIG